MKLQRFIGDFDLSQATIINEDPDLFNQLKNVLRLSNGDKIILADGKGSEAEAEIQFQGKHLSFRITGNKMRCSEPDKKVTLYCAILKKENFELVAQKATECGVEEIVPILSARTVKTGLRQDRLEKIIKEAAEQCGRGMIPQLGESVNLTEALVQAGEDTKILFDKQGGEICVPAGIGKVSIFIGPEGGWTKEEIDMAREKGCVIASLGGLTLRGETAAIVASYLAVNGSLVLR